MAMFMENGWNPNQHMPPRNPGTLAKDLDQLLNAWRNGPASVPGGKWMLPPTGGKPAQVAGDDYPNKAHFNKPSLKAK
jgi:hypothetical protein